MKGLIFVFFVFGIPKGFSVRAFKELLAKVKLEDLKYFLKIRKII